MDFEIAVRYKDAVGDVKLLTYPIRNNTWRQAADAVALTADILQMLPNHEVIEIELKRTN